MRPLLGHRPEIVSQVAKPKANGVFSLPVVGVRTAAELL